MFCGMMRTQNAGVIHQVVYYNSSLWESEHPQNLSRTEIAAVFPKQQQEQEQEQQSRRGQKEYGSARIKGRTRQYIDT